jgi:DNA polymerase-1
MYKQNRLQQPQSLNPLEFLPAVKRGLDASGIIWIECDHAEADDVIATLALREDGRDIYVMSTDKDYYQMLGGRVKILNTAMKNGQTIIDDEYVFKRYHVAPFQWCDFRALIGDPADNIAGVPGVGPKTAARILADRALLENLDGLGRLEGRIGALIRIQMQRLLKSREILKFRTIDSVPLLVSNAVPQLKRAADIVQALGLW